MSIFDKRDNLAEAIRRFNELPWATPTWGYYTISTGNYYNPETHDVVPKKDFLEKEIARKEEELRQVEIRHRQHEDRIREEISILKDQRDKRKRDK